MAKEEKKPLISETAKKVVMMIIGTLLAVLVLAFSVLTIQHALQDDYVGASQFLTWVFLFLGLTKLIAFFKTKEKEDLIRGLVLLVFNIGLGVLAYFGQNNPYIFCVVAGLYSVSIIISRALKFIKHHTMRDIIINVLIIVFAILMAVAFFTFSDASFIGEIVIIECFIIAVSAFVEVATVSLSRMKFTVLFKIIIRTYAFEVLFGLLVTMVTFSLIIPHYEEKITNFVDALWYCFAVVTTIGFGDFYAASPVGRILTVILGVYGIFVVAIITSIIVNFYNETNGKKDAKEIEEVKKEVRKKNKKD